MIRSGWLATVLIGALLIVVMACGGGAGGPAEPGGITSPPPSGVITFGSISLNPTHEHEVFRPFVSHVVSRLEEAGIGRGRIVVVAALCGLSALHASYAEDVADVYEKVNTSVVVIETTQREVGSSGTGQLVEFGGLGSGVLISEDGKVMTAAHVVQSADYVTVRFLSGETIPVEASRSAERVTTQLDRMTVNHGRV